jgi:hypothetical protein
MDDIVYIAEISPFYAICRKNEFSIWPGLSGWNPESLRNEGDMADDPRITRQ